MEEKKQTNFFEGLKKSEYIPPNYDGSDDDDDVTDIDEGAEETEIEKLLKKDEEKMITSPLSQSQPTSSWGQPGGTSWNSPSSSPSNPWSNPSSNTGGYTWGQSTSTPKWGQSNSSPWNSSTGNQQKVELDRNKKIIFIDFLDCIVETYGSNGQPGLLPRDIYDLKPRFDVWFKLAAFNPERIYAIIPVNLIPNTNGIAGWQQALGYFCCCLSAFLRVPYTNCQILAQSRVGQPKEEVMASVIGRCQIDRNKILSVGIYSGLYSQSDRDKVAADKCGIDHIDLTQLLNNTF